MCKLYNSPAFKLPKTPELPYERVNYVKPFHHTGIDFTGFFLVRDEKQEERKVYILIFTCLNTRAIHLEVVHSMSLEDFILTFIRFYYRFSVPRVIYAENAKTFTSSASLLTNLIASNGFQQKFMHFNIEIKHILAYSP